MLRLFGIGGNRRKDNVKDAPFSPVAEPTGRIICAWAGVLPRTPYCRHYLSAIDIRPDSFRARLGEPSPFRSDPKNNVEIILGFRYLFAPKHWWLLYRYQGDLRLPSCKLETVVESVGAVIAHELRAAKTANKLIQYNDDWILTINAVYNRELNKALTRANISPVHFKNNPEFYRQQYLR